MIQRNEQASPFSVSGLCVARGDTPVLWDVSVAIRSGALTAIVGPNGAGKTTLLHAAVGIVPTMAGSVRFFGGSFAEMRRRIAFVPQRESVDWDFPITALEVVEMGATRGAGWLVPTWAQNLLGRSSSAAARRSAALAALARVGLEERAGSPIGELSGGQQQRVFLARALAQDGDLLLLDEPFAGVDATTEAIVTSELRRLTTEGKTVVAVHHDLDDVRDRFDDAILLNGRLCAAGDARRVLTQQAIEDAYRARPLSRESLEELTAKPALTGASH